VAALAAVAILAACGGSSGGGKTSLSAPGKASIKGQTITVLLPYPIPKALIAQFTAKTGVKVNYTVTGWDALHSKLIVANTAKTYIADVTEFDWSFTGQFAGKKWDEPLEGALDPALLKDLAHTSSAFTSGGHTYAACYSNDFRMPIYNGKMFQRAGVASFPTTFADLSTTIAKLKSAGVKYPLAIPMGATEGGVTPWYLLTLAMGGQLFDSSFKPLFADPGSAGYKALQFEVDAVKNGWVSPGSVTLDDGPTADKFDAGANAILLASSPGSLATANDPKSSAIHGTARAGLMPGANGPGHSFGLPEGLAIPVTAKHKDAALAFIQWWEEPGVSGSLYGSEGMLPCRGSVLAALAKNGTLQDGQTISAQLAQVVPLFPQGAPVWYSTFSSDAQGLLNAAVKGNMSVADALKQLADKATKLAAKGS
jgi:multiple sugar transport system substrate-binding protein